MSIRILGRSGLLLLLAILITGCASNSSERLKCKLDPNSCMYEGSYEQGEEEFAEQEAKDLNKAQSRKLRRRSIWL